MFGKDTVTSVVVGLDYMHQILGKVQLCKLVDNYDQYGWVRCSHASSSWHDGLVLAILCSECCLDYMLQIRCGYVKLVVSMGG